MGKTVKNSLFAEHLGRVTNTVRGSTFSELRAEALQLAGEYFGIDPADDRLEVWQFTSHPSVTDIEGRAVLYRADVTVALKPEPEPEEELSEPSEPVQGRSSGKTRLVGANNRSGRVLRGRFAPPGIPAFSNDDISDIKDALDDVEFEEDDEAEWDDDE
jgi:hypothetical protein